MSGDVRILIGRNVKRIRIAQNISQAELADRMGIDRGYISGLELGQRNPTVVTLWHLGEALGVKISAFFEGEKPRLGPR